MLRMMPMPADANVHGDVFGGWIMSHVDVAGAIPAARRAGGRVATVAVTSFVFKQAVFVGDLVSFYADIVKLGTTSITVDVEVYVERNRLEKEVVKVTEATLVYVATDEQRKPRMLPPVYALGARPSSATRARRCRRQWLAGDIAADNRSQQAIAFQVASRRITRDAPRRRRRRRAGWETANRSCAVLGPSHRSPVPFGAEQCARTGTP